VTSPLPASAALIVAAGSGSRFGGDKVTLPLLGRPVLAWSLKAFQETEGIVTMVIVVPRGREEEFRGIVRSSGVSKPVAIVAGGPTRRDSVILGLSSLPPEIQLVAIHDAARPLVTPDLILRCLEAAAIAGASAAAAPVTETLHLADQERNAVRTIDRTGLWAMQTPQVFRAAPLTRLLEVAAPGTDEVSAALEAGWKIPFVENLRPNPKITWPCDLEVASALLTMQGKM
jgi:2-C-methyl-D-erythritol 4-phosphate cytidylyltransferase